MSRRRSRIIWRSQGGEDRAYCDLRPLGGKVVALKAPGEARALTRADRALAEARAAQLIAEAAKDRAEGRERAVFNLPATVGLADAAREHLVAKATAGQVTDRWLEQCERHLRRAVAHFGGGRDLSTITVKDVREWDATLVTERLSGGSRRHLLNSLSNLYRRAQAEGAVLPGYNPVAALMEKPSANREEAKWLEVHEAALLLEAARAYQPKRDDLAMPFAYPLVATFLLTGGRRAEVLGLEVDDISFDRKTVTFRPNAWRRLKTGGSHRVVPLWPQLEEILRPYVFGDRPPARLVFPSFRTGAETMLTDFRKLLDAVAAKVGSKPGELSSKMFRHTYASSRLQTLDHGEPVSIFTVSRELGHGSEALVKRIYGHLGQVRHRAEVVEFRVEQHAERLGERLRTLYLVA